MTGFRGGMKSLLLGCTSMGLLIAATAAANAGGFALREQSAYGQGSSFAGIAAGGSLSSMFWNPATMTQQKGMQFEQVFSGVMPYANQTPLAGSTFAAFGGVSDSGDNAIVPAGYFSYQINDKLYVGLSANSPFGLSVSFPDRWAGRNFAENTFVRSYNFAPSIAYELNDWISVGLGFQVQYATGGFVTGLPVNAAGTPGVASLTNTGNLQFNGYGYGFTAGVTLKPTPTTTVGIGYRSAINQKVDGSFSLPAGGVFTPAFGSTPGAVETTLHLPGTFTIGLRQRFSPQWTLLAGFEWTNWSRIGTSNVNQTNGAAATLIGNPVTIPLNYKDGYFYSLGAEYEWNQALTLRSGIAFEKSPITNDVRTPRLPDNDRFWLSAGLSYKFNQKLSLDFAYTHIWVKDSTITNTLGAITYVGAVDARVDIVSLGIKYRFDEPPARVKQAYLK